MASSVKIPISKLLVNNGQIKDVPKNPRLIKDAKFEKLKQSIQDDPEMLELRELLVYPHEDKYVVLGGNMRLRACKELGYKEMECKVIPEDTPAKKLRAVVQKDNIGYGENDWDMLANEWDAEELDEWGLDTPDDWGEEKEIEEDEVPEVDESEPPKSKLGEVYQLGQHRVICGSATSIDDYSKLMGDIRADLIFTDPPYNMAYTGSATKRRKAIENDKIENFQEFINDTLATLSSFAKPSAPYYVFTCEEEIKTVKNGFVASGLKPHQTLIWKKHRIGFGGSDYQHQYEPFIYGWKSHKERYMVNKRNLSDIWEFARPASSELHPTMKPIELIAYGLTNSSKDGDVVIDGFLGSGSTMIACEQTGRICYGSELDPKYVDVIRKRYWKFINDNNEEGWEENTPAIEE